MPNHWSTSYGLLRDAKQLPVWQQYNPLKTSFSLKDLSISKTIAILKENKRKDHSGVLKARHNQLSENALSGSKSVMVSEKFTRSFELTKVWATRSSFTKHLSLVKVEDPKSCYLRAVLHRDFWVRLCLPTFWIIRRSELFTDNFSNQVSVLSELWLKLIVACF